MKILFIGGAESNCGPENVNRYMRRNFTKSFWYVKAKNRYIKTAETLWKSLFSDVVVVSGVSRQGMVAVGFARALGKKTAYIMHGCGAYETVINHEINCEKGLAQERFLLKHTDLLLPVSRKFQGWVCRRYPQYAHKTSYLYNGIDTSLMNYSGDATKVKGSVAATGADREVKNNIMVARAVEELEGRARLKVYGAIYHKAPKEFDFAQYTGVIPHPKFIDDLMKTEVFVQNSLYEPFSLSVIEALQCGCSVLLSENVGAGDLLEQEESDIIHDPMDVGEIREKIEYLLEHPNNQRIMSKLDLNEYSYAKSVERLEQMCLDLLNGRCPVEK